MILWAQYIYHSWCFANAMMILLLHKRGMILEQVSHSASQEWLAEWRFFSTVLSVRNCDLKCSDLHLLRQHFFEIGNETSCFQVLSLLVNNPAVCVVQMRRYVVSRVGSDPLRRYPGCCSTPIDVRSLPPSSAFLWSNFGLLSTGFPQFVAESIQTIPCITNVVSGIFRPFMPFCNAAYQLMWSVSEK